MEDLGEETLDGIKTVLGQSTMSGQSTTPRANQTLVQNLPRQRSETRAIGPFHNYVLCDRTKRRTHKTERTKKRTRGREHEAAVAVKQTRPRAAARAPRSETGRFRARVRARVRGGARV